jgi:cytochrome c oxidase cbb3-type subunit IV
VDLSDLRTIVTTLSFIAFLGVVVWAYNSKQKARFDDAANLPFVDDDESLKTPRSPGGAHE